MSSVTFRYFQFYCRCCCCFSLAFSSFSFVHWLLWCCNDRVAHISDWVLRFVLLHKCVWVSNTFHYVFLLIAWWLLLLLLLLLPDDTHSGAYMHFTRHYSATQDSNTRTREKSASEKNEKKSIVKCAHCTCLYTAKRTGKKKQYIANTHHTVR